MIGVGAVHLLVWGAALWGALAWQGVDGSLGKTGIAIGACLLLAKLSVAGTVGSLRELWRHTSLEDLGALLLSAVAAAPLCAALVALGGTAHAAPRVALADAAFSIVGLGALRVVPRLFHELLRPALRRPARRVILVGRAELLDLELRRQRAMGRSTVRAVGLIIEGPPLLGARLRRVPVLGVEELARLADQGVIDEVLLVPPVGAGLLELIGDVCRRTGVPCRPAPSPHALSDLLARGTELLLERPPVRLDDRSIADMVRGRRALVTGAGGSIGSELVRQLLRFEPESIVLVERSENALFLIEHELLARRPQCRIEAHVLDVRDAAAVDRLFHRARPHLVLHAAAHKHVPMMERHPAEAAVNNVLGTRAVADAAHRAGVEHFVFISTDKAVNPTSVMGATKRLGELYVQAMARRSRTRFVAVRFGNVLGSNGSVVPIFIEQIQRGGPVTITHPDMQRYFMSIPEACQLVLQAAALGEGGEVFVLDMGCAVRIVDLARRLIEHAGLRPDEDIPIVFSGTRPGEKLYEQLTLSAEGARKTRHPSIWVGQIEPVNHATLARGLEELSDLALAADDPGVRRKLQQLLPDYQPADRTRPVSAEPHLQVEPERAEVIPLPVLTASR